MIIFSEMAESHNQSGVVTHHTQISVNDIMAWFQLIIRGNFKFFTSKELTLRQSFFSIHHNNTDLHHEENPNNLLRTSVKL